MNSSHDIGKFRTHIKALNTRVGKLKNKAALLYILAVCDGGGSDGTEGTIIT